jgi:hypothetical protein
LLSRALAPRGRRMLAAQLQPKPNYGHHRSDRMAELLCPVHGVRDAQRRKGVKPHDFSRDNRAHIKALQKLNEQRRQAAEAAKTPKASPRFANVESRVAAALARPATADPALPPRKPPEPKPFACPKPDGPAGRVFTAWAPPPLLYEGMPEHEPGARKPPVPRRDELAAPPAAPTVDFVKRNAELSSLTPRKTVAAAAPGSPPGTGGKSRHHGRLPPYLLDRKLELAQQAEERAARARPRECPEGTHFLEELERVRVLGLVRDGQRKLHAELDKMPFVIDTHGLRAKHEALSLQLTQLEAAEKAFSRRKVVVQDEETMPDELPAPLPPSLEKQLTRRLKSVLDAAAAEPPPPAPPPPAPLVVEDM